MRQRQSPRHQGHQEEDERPVRDQVSCPLLALPGVRRRLYKGKLNRVLMNGDGYSVSIVCSACLTEACAQATQMCEEGRRASFILTHARHEEKCPLCSTGTEILRNVLEAVCRRDGISIESHVEPGHPARNYELAERLGISVAFK
jgi:hypothetical protein